jgi:hypothetical protein
MEKGQQMGTDRRHSDVGLLLRILDEAYHKKAWYGPNLRGSLRGVTAGQAAWKPSPQRHSIWELVRHATYWKYAVRRRLLGERRGTFPIGGSNWFDVPSPPNETAWKRDVALLAEVHSSLRDAVSKMTTRDLQNAPRGSKVINETIIYGIAFHDVYHSGQIQLLKQLQKKG